MSTFSAGHRCPGCGSDRIERRGLHGWFEQAVLPRLERHTYRCRRCERRFWDRPHRRPSSGPPAAEGDTKPRGHVDGSLETTPYSRMLTYALIGLPWVGLLVLFFARSEEHTSELQSRLHLVCRLLLEKKKPYS